MTDESRIDMLVDGLKPVESSEAAPAVPTALAVPVQPQSVAPPPATTATVTPTPVKATVVAPKSGGIGVVSPPTSTIPPGVKIVQTPVVITPPVTGLSAAVNKASGRTLPIPKGLLLGNTNDDIPDYMHACVYAETSARKTSTAARFGDAADVRIVLTRRKEQLIPLKGMGYQYAEVSDAASLTFALMYPEQLWPDWALRPNRTLVLDDGTQAVDILLEDASEIDGKEVKDRRRSYTEAGKNLREILASVLRKPMHFILVALAKVRENALTNEERIAPDLPPSMQGMLMTELEFVFYIDTKSWTMFTDRDRISVKDTDPNTGKEKTFIREIFAKNKLSLMDVGKNVLLQREKLDLAEVWKKVQKIRAGIPAVKK